MHLQWWLLFPIIIIIISIAMIRVCSLFAVRPFLSSFILKISDLNAATSRWTNRIIIALDFTIVSNRTKIATTRIYWVSYQRACSLSMHGAANLNIHKATFNGNNSTHTNKKRGERESCRRANRGARLYFLFYATFASLFINGAK